MNNITRIKGLSEIRRIPRLGKIYLGIKVPVIKNGKQVTKNGQPVTRPKEVDYFVCPPEVQAIYGECPKELDIVLPCEDLSKAYPQAYRYWKGSAGLYCKGDGEIAYRMTEAEEQRRARAFVEQECLGEHCPDYQAKNCNHSASLMVGLPKIKPLGVYQIDTRSYHSIVGVNSDLEYLQQALGKIANLVDVRTAEVKTVLVLRRKPQETHGSGRKEIHHILSIELALSTQELLEMRGYIGQPLLAAPMQSGSNLTQPTTPAPQPQPVQAVYEMPPLVEENPLDSEQEPETEENAAEPDVLTGKRTYLGALLIQRFGKGSRNIKPWLMQYGADNVESLGENELGSALDAIKALVDKQTTQDNLEF